jgi:putative membrane protein
MTLETLTLLSTTFIVLSGVSLLVGWWLIRNKRIEAHRNMMLSASGFAGLFLIAYVTRWGMYGSKSFEGTGIWKTIYLSILIPHIILAMAVAPLAVILIDLALRRKQYPRHKKLARWVLPIWLFVAASGWAVYFMLYRMF